MVGALELEFYNSDGTGRRTILRHVRMSKGIVRADLTWQAMDCGIIVNYQDPENFGVALLDYDGGTITGRYVEYVDGQKRVQRTATSVTFSLTAGQTYAIQAVVRQQYPSRVVKLYVDRNQDNDFGDLGEQVMSSFMILGVWDGGHVGLYRETSSTTTTLQWDNFICGYDTDNDEIIGTVGSPDTGDYVYAQYNFNDAEMEIPIGWNTVLHVYDASGNLTGDGLFQYQYDAWNRLTGVWYADGNMSQATERVACYRYDGLSRRVWKQVTNQGEGVVYHSDDDGVTGIQAGDRHEHYFYSGWRLVETTNHVNGLISGVYDYAVSYVLNQFVYGTQYIDEPVRYDRNLQPSAQNRTCIGTGGDDLDASYFYHQDANYRVVALTDEDGYVVERTTYAAYGEPTVSGGVDSGVAAELGNPLPASTVGNPFLHQGLFRDRESLSYQNRFRQG